MSACREVLNGDAGGNRMKKTLQEQPNDVFAEPESQEGRMGALGLPASIRGLLFDMDGVLTETATIHAAAWKETFDAVLCERLGEDFEPFDPVLDYGTYVDGKPRYDGVRSFLQARGIKLPQGEPSDAPGHESVCAIGNIKNIRVRELIESLGVEAFPGSLRYLDAARDAGLPAAVVSSSANARTILKAANLNDRFTVIVDASVARERRLPGKPAPDTYLEGARMLGVKPAEAAVFEDALAGVQAGRDGAFGAVIGVDRLGQTDALRQHGATIVVNDLDELLGETL
jgi:beta-phosphoglucomutase family hydrolase